MIDIAVKNGISRKLYQQRVGLLGWSKERAATEPKGDYYKGEFAVYRGGEIIAMGSAEECAEKMGVKPTYIRWLTTPTGRKRLASRKDPENATTAVKLDCD